MSSLAISCLTSKDEITSVFGSDVGAHVLGH